MRNEDFRFFVLKQAFKGYKFDPERHRVERCYKLNGQELDRITSSFSEFGFKSKADASCCVNDILNRVKDGILWNPSIEQFICLRNTPGVAMTLTTDFDKQVRLIFLGGFDFFVCGDDGGFLRYGDILRCLTGGFSLNNSAYFSLKRGGKFILGTKRVIALIPHEIRLSADDDRNFNHGSPSEVQQVKRFVFSWKAVQDSRGNAYFTETSLTDSRDAAIKLDLSKQTFSFNKNFRFDTYNKLGQDFRESVLIPIAMLQQRDWNDVELSALRMAKEGRFQLSYQNLLVTEKMELTAE